MFHKINKDIKDAARLYETYWSVEVHPITGEVYFRPKWFKCFCVFTEVLRTMIWRKYNYILPYYFIHKPFKKDFLLYPDYLCYEEKQWKQNSKNSKESGMT